MLSGLMSANIAVWVLNEEDRIHRYGAMNTTTRLRAKTERPIRYPRGRLRTLPRTACTSRRGAPARPVIVVTPLAISTRPEDF